jgi:O-antigen/teichoic acid export membrane protein
MAGITKTILKNAVVLLAGDAGANVLRLVSVAILAGTLGAEEFGVYVLLLTYTEVVNRLFNFQTWEALIKFGTEAVQRGNRLGLATTIKSCLALDLLSMLLATGIAVVCAGFFVSFFKLDVAMVPVARLLSLSLLCYAAETSIGVLRMYDRFRVNARITVVAAGVQVALFAVVGRFAPSLVGFVYATLGALLVALILKVYFLIATLQAHVGLSALARTPISLPEMRRSGLADFVIYRNVDVAVRMVSRQFDVFALAWFFGAEIVGVYRLAVYIANVLGKIADPLYQAMYPDVTKLVASSRLAEAREVGIRVARYLAAICVGFYLTYAAFGQGPTASIFGEEFRRSYSVALVYLLPVMIAFVAAPLFTFQLSFGQARNLLRNQLLSTGFYLAALFSLVPIYSHYGAALAYLVYYVVIVTLTYLNVRRCFREPR